MDSGKGAMTDGLSGTVAVDASTDQTSRAFDKVLARLRAFGWKIGGQEGVIDLVDASAADLMPGAKACIIRCATKAETERLDAIEPDGFTILSALGAGRLERALAASVTGGLTVDKVIVGFNWTMVQAGDLCGIARSPSRDTQGARTIRPEEGFIGKELDELAAYLCSSDCLKRSLGLAAVNCYWNRPDPLPDLEAHLVQKGGFASVPPPGKGLIVVGGFRGVQKRLPEARIVEREPKPGDIAIEDAPQAYRSAKQLAITAQTLMNGSLEPLLRESVMVPHRMLVGPSTPLCPLLLEHGLNEVSGLVVTDPGATEQFINETGTMIMLDRLVEARFLR